MSTDETRRSDLADDVRDVDAQETTVEIGRAGDLLASCETEDVSIVAKVGPDADRDTVQSAVRSLRDELAYYASGIDD